MQEGARHASKRYPLAFALTVLLFAVWGGAHRVIGIVSPEFEHFFGYSCLQSSFVSLGVNLSYFVIAVPVALFLRRLGYKLGLISGLGAFAFGALLVFPAVARHAGAFYLASIIVTGVGWAFLEVSANALIVGMGPSETAVRRLNLAQCFYPVGLLTASAFADQFTIPPQVTEYGAFVDAVVRPYIILGLGVLLLAFVVEQIEFPRLANERTKHGKGALGDLKWLLASRSFLAGAAVLAVSSVGIVSLWSSTGRYAQHVLVTAPATGWLSFSLATWWLCTAGRIVGTGLMVRFDPMRLLTGFAAAAVVLCLVPAGSDSASGLIAMLAASFFISIMFPTIFAQTIKDLGSRTKMGAGVLVAASGLGGFVGTTVQHAAAVAAPELVHASLAAAALCFVPVFWYGLAAAKHRPDAGLQQPSTAPKETLTPTAAESA